MPILLYGECLVAEQPLLPPTDQIEADLAWLQEEQQVFSASRVEESIAKTAASVTIVDADAIRTMGVRHISEVLDRLPGIRVRKQRFWPDMLEVRGIATESSEKILMMLNGHPLDNDLVNGGAMWTYDRLSIEHVERIEVVRGPASALYGANAFLALVNVITKSARRSEERAFSQVVGEDNTLISNLYYAERFENALALTANLQHEQSDGDRARVEADSIGQSGRTDPWHENTQLYAELAYGGFVMQTNYTRREDGPYLGLSHVLNNDDNGDSEAWYMQAQYTAQFTPTLRSEIKSYYDRFRFDNFWKLFPEGYPAPDFTAGLKARSGATNSKLGAEALFTYTPSEASTLLVGGLWEKHRQFDVIYATTYDPLTLTPLPEMTDQSAPDTTWAPEVDRDFWALYAEWLYDVNDQVRLNIGGRYDAYSDFGEVFNPRLGFSWVSADEALGFKAMYAEGFRAPTFAELYNINNPSLLGNPDLKPERIRTYEFTGTARLSRPLSLQITYFSNRIVDLVSQIDIRHANVGSIESRGVESTLTYTLPRGSYLSCNYTYIEAEDALGEPMPTTPPHRLHAQMHLRLDEKFSFYAHLAYTASAPRAQDDTRAENGAYALGDVTLWGRNLLARKNLDVQVNITNILDREYVHDSPISSNFGPLSDDYPMPGRKLFLKAIYHF